MSALVSLSNSWSRFRKKIAIKKLTMADPPNTHIHTPPTTEVLVLPPPWIHTLPDELISYILVTTANSMSASAIDPDLEWNADIPRSELPLLAQVVCRRWMYIVRGTQVLWTVLDVKKDRRANYQLHAERSGVLPLDVHVEAIQMPCIESGRRGLILVEECRERDQKMLAAIRPHEHRIQKLRIRGGDWQDINGCIQTLPQTIPNLLELGISMNPKAPYARITTYLILPRLRSLSAHHFPHYWPDSCKGYNLDLEEMYLIGVATGPSCVVELARVLRSYRNLRKLVFRDWVIYDCHGCVPMREPLVLERLETLSLTKYSVGELDRLFRFVVAPQLQVLRFVERPMSYERDPETVTLYFPMLETLELEMNPRFALEIARQVPSAKHLTIQLPDHFSVSKDQTLDALLLHWQSLRHPLPLETLVIKGIQAASLVTFLEDNQNQVVPLLHKVSIHYKDTFLSKDKGQFVIAAETRRRLSAVVELEVCGLSDAALRARRGVHSWKQEQAWANGFGISLD